MMIRIVVVVVVVPVVVIDLVVIVVVVIDLVVIVVVVIVVVKVTSGSSNSNSSDSGGSSTRTHDRVIAVTVHYYSVVLFPTFSTMKERQGKPAGRIIDRISIVSRRCAAAMKRTAFRNELTFGTVFY